MFIIQQHTVSKFTNFKSSSCSAFRPYVKRVAQSWKQSSPIRFLSLQEYSRLHLAYSIYGQDRHKVFYIFIRSTKWQITHPPCKNMFDRYLQTVTQCMSIDSVYMPLLWDHCAFHVAINCCSHNVSTSVSSMSNSCSQSSSLLSGTQQNNHANIHNMFIYENSGACPCSTLFYLCKPKFN